MLTSCDFLEFNFGEYRLEMQRDVLGRGLEQFRHLRLRQPDSAVFQPYLDTRMGILGLKQDDFGF